MMLKATLVSYLLFEIALGYQLSISHFTNFVSTYQPRDENNQPCRRSSAACLGGIARLHEAIKRLHIQRSNFLMFNIGDNFSGSLYYNLWRWNITQFFLNKLLIDAMTIGNHELDDGVDFLKEFLHNSIAPVVLSNLNDNNEVYKQDLIKRELLLSKGGKNIGILGILFSNINETSNTEDWSFSPEIEAVNKHAKSLLRQGAFTVIVLSHCTYKFNKKLAAETIPGVSVIIGGHLNTLLYRGYPPYGKKVGTYPTVIKRADGSEVLVLHTLGKGSYLGDLTIQYSNTGKIKSYQGNPIALDTPVSKYNVIEALLKPYTNQIDQIGEFKIGETVVHIDATKCQEKECYLGNFITDSMVYHYMLFASEEKYWTRAAIALTNSGGLKESIAYGAISYRELLSSVPFLNLICVAALKGDVMIDIFEFMAAPYLPDEFDKINILQVAGVKVVIDMKKPVGKRIVSLLLRCEQCAAPSYHPVNKTAMYRVALPTFLLDGRGGYSMIPRNAIDIECSDYDIDILVEYVSQSSPIAIGLQDRIKILT